LNKRETGAKAEREQKLYRQHAVKGKVPLVISKLSQLLLSYINNPRGGWFGRWLELHVPKLVVEPFPKR
jgi:hypothetical protein